MTIGERLREASAALAAVSDTPKLDAELLLAHALGWPRAKLLAEKQSALPESPFDTLLTRRLNHEPIAYILGDWGFYSLTLEVRPPLLVPRPETEHLVEQALAFLRGREGTPRVLDLCTGTGCVILALAKNATIHAVATDISPVAIEVARRNAARLGVQVELYRGDLFQALPRDSASFDLIVSNPPYVRDAEWEGLSPVIRKHEDRNALLAGGDGLDCIRRIVHHAPHWLRPGGMLALEMGEEQGPAVAALLSSAGFQSVRIIKDLAGHDRIATGVVG